MTEPRDPLPLDAATTPEARDMRGISTCWQNAPRGWHAYGSGPCFDTYEQAIEYRNSVDTHGFDETRRRYGLR